VPAAHPGPVRPGDDELREGRAATGVRRRGGLGVRQGEHRAHYGQGAEEARGRSV